jgi:hypothetical protein
VALISAAGRLAGLASERRASLPDLAVAWLERGAAAPGAVPVAGALPAPPVLCQPPGRRLGPLWLDGSVSGDAQLPCTGSHAHVTLDR